MRLGRAAAYAVLATTHLAEHQSGRPTQGRDIADACGVPSGHLLKILQQLVRAQILNSERGPAGGFVLRRPAEDISVLEIVEAIDGPVSGDLMLRDVSTSAEPARARLESACQEIADNTRAVLARTRIADFVRPQPAAAAH